MAKEKRVRYNTGIINGEALSIRNDRFLNEGTGSEALSFVLDVEVEEGLVLPVDFFINKFLPNGSSNTTYNEMMATYDKLRTREDNGEGEKVNCMIRFETNDYVNKEGEIVRGVPSNSIVFCTRESKSKYSITPDNKGKVYGLLKGYEKSEDGSKMILKFLVNSYAYVNQQTGELKASGFILNVMIHDNEEYMAYVEEELKVGDILYLEFDIIRKTHAIKTRGIGARARAKVNVENYLELTFCSEPLGFINEDGELVKNEFEDLDENESFYLVIDREDFPFTPEYIALMEESIEKKKEKLEAKAEEVKANMEEEDNSEDVPF